MNVTKQPDFTRAEMRIQARINDILTTRMIRVAERITEVVQKANLRFFTDMVSKAVDVEQKPDLAPYNAGKWRDLGDDYKIRKLKLHARRKRERVKSDRAAQATPGGGLPRRFFYFRGDLKRALRQLHADQVFGEPEVTFTGTDLRRAKSGKTFKKGDIVTTDPRRSRFVMGDYAISIDVYPKAHLVGYRPGELEGLLFGQETRDGYKLMNHEGSYRPFVLAYLRWFQRTQVLAAIRRVIK